MLFLCMKIIRISVIILVVMLHLTSDHFQSAFMRLIVVNESWTFDFKLWL